MGLLASQSLQIKNISDYSTRERKEQEEALQEGPGVDKAVNELCDRTE